MKTLFDLVAPIAIYHGADLTYEKEARAAIAELRKRVSENTLRNTQFVADDRMLDYLEHSHPDDLPNIIDIYNELFVEICEDVMPDGFTGRDKWGARRYLDSTGKEVFSGDKCGDFPWYADEASLRERLTDHLEEMDVDDAKAWQRAE